MAVSSSSRISVTASREFDAFVLSLTFHQLRVVDVVIHESSHLLLASALSRRRRQVLTSLSRSSSKPTACTTIVSTLSGENFSLYLLVRETHDTGGIAGGVVAALHDLLKNHRR